MSAGGLFPIASPASRPAPPTLPAAAALAYQERASVRSCLPKSAVQPRLARAELFAAGSSLFARFWRKVAVSSCSEAAAWAALESTKAIKGINNKGRGGGLLIIFLGGGGVVLA